MEHLNTEILFTTATLMVTFAGFSVLFLAIRQMTGKALSSIDIFLTTAVVVFLLTITAGALLPAILSMYDIPQVWIWRVSALLYGLPMLALLLTYRSRRIAATGKPPTLWGHVVLIGFGSLNNATTIVYTFGDFPNPAAVYSTTLAVNFFIIAFTFVQSFQIILREGADISNKPVAQA